MKLDLDLFLVSLWDPGKVGSGLINLIGPCWDCIGRQEVNLLGTMGVLIMICLCLFLQFQNHYLVNGFQSMVKNHLAADAALRACVL